MGRGKNVDIDKNTLIAAIKEAESKETFKNISAMCKAVAAKLDIPHTVVPNRIKKWSIPINTKAGKVFGERSTTPVDTKKIATVIQELEEDGPMKNLGELCKAVGEILEISPSSVSKFIRDTKPDLKTQSGEGKGIAAIARGRVRKDMTEQKNQFTAAVNEAEKNGPFASLSELYRAVGTAIDRDPASVGNYIKKYEIPTKTQAGKKGKPSTATFDKQQLVDTINKIEIDGARPSLSVLYHEAGELLGVSAGTIINKIKQYEIPIKTQAAPKGHAFRVEVDKDELIAAIEEVEENGAYANFLELSEDVAKLMSSQTITPGLVRARIIEWGIPTKTPQPKKREKSDGTTKTAAHLDAPDAVLTSFVIIPSESAVESYAGKFRPVFIPAGKCPAKPERLDHDAFYEWIREVQDDGLREGLFYQPEAYKQFARQFYDVNNREEFDEAKALVDECFTRPPLEEVLV